MEYIHRVIEPKLLEYLNIFPVVGLAGPRQSGKSTVIRELLGQKYEYVTFDDPTTLRIFSEDPEGFMKSHQNKVIFDEAQRAPDIFHYIKMAVDEDRKNYGKFVVTGSAQFSLFEKISESLAGRIGLLTLLPLEYDELPYLYKERAVYKGQYPELSEHSYQHTEAWYSSYVNTYLEKDVRALNDIGNLRDFNRLLSLLAVQAAQPLNISQLAKSIGVSAPTIKRWISVLEASYIIFLLPPFYENYGKRLVKSPKVYFYDTGLVSYLTGIETEKQYSQGPMAGSIFENYVISDIAKRIAHRKLNYDLYYYRTSHGAEVDLIIDKKQSKEFIEIKKSATFNPKMAAHLLTMMEQQQQDGYHILYNGVKRSFKEVDIKPYWDVPLDNL